MKFGIDIGHNCPPDIGAKGLELEDHLTLEIGNTVIAKLKSLGHEVIQCKPTKVDTVKESLAKRCETANAAKVDLFVSIHLNAFNGQAHGTEIFAISEKGKIIAKAVLDEIVKLGFGNRGVKNGSQLFVLKHTTMPAILIECCFVDSPKDMKLFSAEMMANAITQGLTGVSFQL
jgi:N-acetylmuramoyl-L-alanine amidase